MKRIFFLISALFFFINYSYSQEWIRVYGDESSAGGRYVIETYDNGYILLADKNSYKYSWIVKTNINGYILWDKRIGNGSYSNIPMSIEQTIDNGYIICGSTTKYNTYSDVYIQKFNVCAEPEWCKLFSNPVDNDYGQRVKQLNDGGYLFLTRYLGDNPEHRTHLTKFDSIGEIEWQHVYAQSDSAMFGEEGFDLLIIDDNRYLITGRCFYPDPGQTGGGWMRSFIIMTDSLGNLVWEIPWVSDGYFHSKARTSLINNGSIYSVGQHFLPGNAVPCLLKTTLQGDELLYADIFDNIYYGGSPTINQINDSMFFITAVWSDYNDNPYTAFLKVDTLGNLIDSLTGYPLSNEIWWTTKTFDGKFVSVGTHYDGNWDMYAFKVNENMEYDSIYTQPFTYDSLCPDSIISETYDLECDILVDIYEPFTTKEGSKMNIFPNPAKDNITIELPKYIISEQNTEHFQVTKVHYQYTNNAVLEFYDIFGHKLKEIKVSKGQQQLKIDVSNWNNGLYVAVLKSEKNVFAKQKFMVLN